jgi:hypothetical protein
MIVAARYYLRLLTSRQAVLAPVLVYLSLVALNNATPTGGIETELPLRAGAVTAVALMPVTAWLTRLVATSESGPFAEVTLVTLGGQVRRQAARSAAVMAVGVLLACVASLWGLLVNADRHHPASVVAAMLGMHLAEALAGAGVGILIAPPLRTRVGTAVAGITGLTLVSLLVPWLPPLNPVLQATFHQVSPAPGLMLLAMGQAAALGVACGVLGTSLARARRPG